MKYGLNFFLVLFALLLFVSCEDQQVVGVPPETYTLNQNYPNPFTDTTRIIYGVPQISPSSPGPWIRLAVYDRFLQRQELLVDNHNHFAGYDTVTWTGYGINGARVAPGLYYIELQKVSGALSDNEDNVEVLRRITALKK